jgi:hypothetical protein
MHDVVQKQPVADLNFFFLMVESTKFYFILFSLVTKKNLIRLPQKKTN